MKTGSAPLLRHATTVTITLLALATSACSTAQIEEPPYRLMKSKESFEIREYSPRLVAQTTVSGTQKKASSQAFRILADYIFGNNTSKSKIAMTAPVSQKSTGTGTTSEKIAMTAPVSQSRSQKNSAETGAWLVQFTMPSEYTLDTLPEPNNPAVELVELPAARYAVLRFPGRVHTSMIASKTRELEHFMQTNQYDAIGESVLAQYNPPWTPGPIRRNEIMIPIR